MMATSILIGNRTHLGGSPSGILEYINTTICNYNRTEMFVTVWLGILEISTGKLTAANAGHEYPAIYRKDRSFELYKDKHGFVAGGMDGMKYKDYEIQLRPGDKVFVYTDGLPEATDSEDKMFGAERMTAALNVYKEDSPQGIIEGMQSSVKDFVGDAPQFDDLTMLCIEYKGTARQEGTDIS